MKRICNIAVVLVTLVVVGWMAIPAEANHGHRGYRGPHYPRHHQNLHRAPHHHWAPQHLHHHHRLYGPHAPHHFRGPRHHHHHIHPRSPAFVYPYAPFPGVGIGVYGPRGGFHFGF